MIFPRITTTILLLALAACGQKEQSWNGTDISGAMPALDFRMTRANNGASVSGADYRGKIAILYFGYTNCPDVCPTTLADLSDAVAKLGDGAKDVRILFVTVDPGRDTQGRLKGYVETFGPQVDGLRGTDNAIASLARRYRVSYSTVPAGDGHPYQVEHSSAVFFFDKTGRALLVITKTDKTAGIVDDLKRLLAS
jgi:protein SCO1